MMKPELLEPMVTDLTVVGRSPRTREAYSACVRHLAEYGSSPLSGRR